MQTDIQEALADMEGLHWRVSEVAGADDSREEWVSIVDLFGKGWPLGLSRSGFWVLASRSGLHILTPNSRLTGLLPCLERKADEVREHLYKALKVLSIPPELAESFPYEGIVRTALSGYSDYWANLALDWLQNGIEMTESIADALSRIPNAKWASQKTRHRAMRCLSRWNG